MAAARSTDDDECIRWMAKQTPDLEFEETLRALRSNVAAALREATKPPAAETEQPMYWELDWADGVRDNAVSLTKELAGEAEDHRRAAEAFAGRPGEEAAVENLRRLAAWWEERRAEGEELVRATRRLWDEYMRAMAAAGEEELTHLAAMDFIQYMHDEIGIPWPQQLDAGVVDAVVKAEGTGARFAERIVQRAGRLRRGAAAIAGRPGEEALAAALLRRAASVEAQCADARALVAAVVATEYWRAFRHLNRRPSAGR